MATIACLVLAATVVPGFAATPVASRALMYTVTAPQVVASGTDTATPVTFSDVNAAYDGAAIIHLTAFDLDSGVAHTYYRLDGGPQTEGTEVTVDTGGDHTLEFWSVDVAGNIEAHTMAYFTVNVVVPDVTAPATTCDVLASYTGSARIDLSAFDDGGSGVRYTYYRLDGDPLADENLTVMTSVVGLHTLEYWSVDWAGNEELPHHTASFTVKPIVSKVTIKTSATTSRIGGVPILSGTMEPTDAIGKIMVVYVMKAGSARWTYSSNRVVYAGPTGNALWQYKYYFKAGMRKGVYKYKAVFPANGGIPGCTSPNVVSITLR